MSMLTFLCICAITIVPIIICLRTLNQVGGARMINADWLDPADKFHLISRWGARN